MPLRPEFREALSLLVEAFARLEKRGIAAPVPVGGAAVELYTGGAVATGDFDFVTPARDEFFEELIGLGFERPGFDHARGVSFLANSLLLRNAGMGLQVVSGLLMDGRAERARIVFVQLDAGRIPVIPVEDLIADRMAQALVSRGDPEKDMQDQCVTLSLLAERLDLTYLDRRIREESADDASLATLKAWTDDRRHSGRT